MKVIKRLYLFALGFLGLSMLGQYIVLDVFHFPFSFMEIYYIPILYVYRNQIAFCFKKLFIRPSQRMILLELVLAAGILIGIVLSFDFLILLNYRSILYMLFVIVFIKYYNVKVNIKTVFWINMFAVLGDLFYINVISSADISSSINCVAIGLSILSAFLLEKYILGCIAFLLSAIAGITSGFRIGIVVSILVLFEGIVFTIFRKDRKKSLRSLTRRSIVICVFIAVIVCAIANYESIIYFVADKLGMSQFAIFRVTERMKGLLSFDISASQDTERLRIFQYPMQRFLRCIVPRGLIGESIGEYWLYIDVPILYLYDLFGSIGTIMILLLIVQKTLQKVKIVFTQKRGYRNNCETDAITLAVLMFPLLVLLEILNGSFAVILFQGIETAAILGFLLKKYSPPKKMNSSAA